MPFRVPKFYFGDISASTTNFVLITESISWADKTKKEFVPGEIEPAYDKYKVRVSQLSSLSVEDWELPDGGPMPLSFFLSYSCLRRGITWHAAAPWERWQAITSRSVCTRASTKLAGRKNSYWKMVEREKAVNLRRCFRCRM